MRHQSSCPLRNPGDTRASFPRPHFPAGSRQRFALGVLRPTLGFHFSSHWTTKSPTATVLPLAASSLFLLPYFYFFTTHLFLFILFFSFAMLLHQCLVSKYFVSKLLFLYCSARVTCKFVHLPQRFSALAASRIT